MSKSFDTLVKDIYELFDGHSLNGAAEKFGLDFGALLGNRFQRYGTVQEPKLYLSNLGKPLRQLWYELKGYKGQDLTPETKFKFLYGDLLELLVLFLAERSGHRVEGLQQRVDVDGVSGRIDAIIDGVLVDVKSCSTFAFQKFQNRSLLEEGNDAFGYVAQLSAYRVATSRPRAAFIAVDKTLGKLCTLELPDNSYDVSGRIATVRKALAGDVEPERCYEPVPVSKTDKSGNLVLGVQCSYCGWKDRCWRDSNKGEGLLLRHYYSGPKWFTKLVREPRLKSTQEPEESSEKFPTKE